MHVCEGGIVRLKGFFVGSYFWCGSLEQLLAFLHLAVF